MYNVHPITLYTSRYDPAKNATVYEASGHQPGMTVKQLYMAHILTGIASNPATMLSPEEHIKYAAKLAELAFELMP